jgi:hypothetical protein
MTTFSADVSFEGSSLFWGVLTSGTTLPKSAAGANVNTSIPPIKDPASPTIMYGSKPRLTGGFPLSL